MEKLAKYFLIEVTNNNTPIGACTIAGSTEGLTIISSSDNIIFSNQSLDIILKDIKEEDYSRTDVGRDTYLKHLKQSRSVIDDIIEMQNIFYKLLDTTIATENKPNC